MFPVKSDVDFVVVCSFLDISVLLLFETADKQGARLMAGGTGTEDCSSPKIMASFVRIK